LTIDDSRCAAVDRRSSIVRRTQSEYVIAARARSVALIRGPFAVAQANHLQLECSAGGGWLALSRFDLPMRACYQWRRISSSLADDGLNTAYAAQH
jgi:hypothetical protein